MAQVLKEDVQQRIAKAALRVFSEKGYAAATMAEIAASAGVSTGNLYRYFETKDVLFAAVVPQALARRLSALVRRKVEALEGEQDVRSLEAGAAWRVVSDELLAFCIANRLAVVVLLAKGKAAGTEHETFSERMAHELVVLATAYARSVHREVDESRAARSALERIYRHFVDAMTEILEQNEEAAAIREAVAHFSTYHLAGMKAFFDRRPT